MPKGFQPIAAPPNRQATTGLVALASTPTGDVDGWEAGFGFAPESCDLGQLLAVDCGPSETKTPADKPDLVAYMPAALVVQDFCTTMDRGRDTDGLARRLLLSQQSALLERLLWTGAATGDATTDERTHLADGRATVLAAGVATPVVQALALLDQALTGCLHGVPGMVHVTPYVQALAKAAGILERDGNRWLTPAGHTVVAGAGYTGGGPRPTVGGALPAAPNLLASPAVDQWAYGTGQVYYLLGAVDVLTDTDHRVNTVTATAERNGAAFYGCCQYAVQVETAPA